jgi:hypothetical protein
MSLHTVSGAEGEAIGHDTDRYRDRTGRLQRTRISEAAMVQTSRLPNPGFQLPRRSPAAGVIASIEQHARGTGLGTGQHSGMKERAPNAS